LWRKQSSLHTCYFAIQFGICRSLLQGIEITPRRQRLEPLQPVQQSEIDLCPIAIVAGSLQLREPTSL
jgi:hypothetical protein